MKRKILAAVITIGVMALIRTDANPALWQVALVTLMFYGINCAVIEAITEELQRTKKRRCRRIETRNIHRWAEVDFSVFAPGGGMEIVS